MSSKRFVTITRQYGSGGHDIGKALAKALGIGFYDKELISLAARESGIAPEVFEKADERPANSLLYSLSVGLYNYGNGLSSPSRSVISEGFFANREKARLSITSKLLRRTC